MTDIFKPKTSKPPLSERVDQNAVFGGEPVHTALVNKTPPPISDAHSIGAYDTDSTVKMTTPAPVPSRDGDT